MYVLYAGGITQAGALIFISFIQLTSPSAYLYRELGPLG